MRKKTDMASVSTELKSMGENLNLTNKGECIISCDIEENNMRETNKDLL